MYVKDDLIIKIDSKMTKEKHLDWTEGVCRGCLASGRCLQELSDYSKRSFFVQIIPEVISNDSVLLCWECCARVSSAVRFQKQVRASYECLQLFTQSGVADLVHKSRLGNSSVRTESYRPDDIYELVKCEDTWRDLEEENKLEVDIVKLEDEAPSPDRHSFTVSDDDELKQLAVLKVPKKSKESKQDITVKKKKRDRKLGYEVVKWSEQDWLEERRTVEESEEFRNAIDKCYTCLVVLEGKESADKHKAKHSEGGDNVRPPRRYRCLACGERARNKKLADRHQRRCGLSNARSDQTATDAIENEGALLGNDELAANVDAKENDDSKVCSSYPCDTCGKVFRWKASLHKHLETHRIQAGESKTPFCEACRLTFNSTANLRKHMRSSSKHQIQVKLKKLPACEADGDQDAATLVQRVHAQLSRFPCPHCDRRFQWKGNLQRHIQSHEARASGELYCAPCERKFSSIATFQQHMSLSKKHVSENDFRYMCSDCGKRFPIKRRLQEHVNWEHLRVFTHKCEICEKIFKRQTSLYLHKQVVHNKSSHHLCDHCGKSFQTRSKLRTHATARHMSDQPFKCSICSATFSWHSCLSRHVKVVHEKIKYKRKRKTKDCVPNALREEAETSAAKL